MNTIISVFFANPILFVAIFSILFILYHSIVIVSGEQIAVLERCYFGAALPEGRVVALRRQVGIQANILGPGLHILIPFIYRVQKFPLTVIGETEVGLVEAIDGLPVTQGRIFARNVSDITLFQDGESFLENNGEKGPQVQVLPPGVYRINPYLFRIEKVPAITISNGEIGVVVSNDGEQIDSGRLLGRKVQGHSNFENAQAFLDSGGQKGPQIDILLPGTYRINSKLFKVSILKATVVPSKKIGLVTARDGQPLPVGEYVARSVSGHSDFQDASSFITANGQRGPQLDFLKPGTYYINPLMFEVVSDDVLMVQRGEVAVIVSNIGKDPTLDPSYAGRDKAGVERYVVEAGYRGIQREVLGPGTYYLNKLAFTPHIIPTTNITIDWAQGDSGSERVFNPLSIVSKDGFEMTVEVKVIIRVLPEQASHMLARIGTIENLIEHVIHPIIDSSFRNQASSTEAMKFMQDRHEQQVQAERHVVTELKKYHAECVSVLICQIKLPERLMETLTNKVVASQQMSMYDSQKEAEGRRKEMEKIKAEANLQPNLVKAEIDVQIASQTKNQQIILAEGKSQSTKLEQAGIAEGIKSVGMAEAEKVKAIGNSTAEAYTKQADALGAQSMALIEVMKQISSGNIKITPEVLVQGQGDKESSGSVLSAFIGSLMLKDAATKQ